MRPICSIDGCVGEHMAHGWCQKHYRRWMRTGDPLGSKPRTMPRRSHCKRGHELAGDNVYVRQADGSRRCRACNRDEVRLKRARAKEATK